MTATGDRSIIKRGMLHVTRHKQHASIYFFLSHPCACASPPINGCCSRIGYLNEHGRAQPRAPALGSSSLRSGPAAK